MSVIKASNGVGENYYLFSERIIKFNEAPGGVTQIFYDDGEFYYIRLSPESFARKLSNQDVITGKAPEKPRVRILEDEDEDEFELGGEQ